MSGMLGQIVGSFLGGGQQGAQHSAIAEILQQVIAGQGSNGLAGLVSRFEDAGLGQAARSWVGTGQNQPITATDLTKVFSSDQIQNWAQQAGTSPESLLQILSEALPKAVDHVTPNGQPPAQLSDVMGLLSSFLGSHAAPKTN